MTDRKSLVVEPVEVDPDESCACCGATPDGPTTLGCPVCEGVVEA